MKKIVLKVSGMHCTSCAFDIDGELEDTEGVKEARTNYAKQETEVDFDEEKVTVEDIIKSINNTGYNASLL